MIFMNEIFVRMKLLSVFVALAAAVGDLKVGS